MATFDYKWMIQNAFRSVVRDVLSSVKNYGLLDDHHFYITFNTDRPDVKISDFVRQKYPKEITIVLQYQFWDLTVEEKGFGVTLSFNNVRETIYVPYAAITTFFDPSVKFNLHLIPDEPATDFSVISIYH